ncbi:MAG: hypothetical protein GY913_17350 [Proteobacteria bacterium]|nr:hypothetical protein [Pseudomonadota bacterium]MCP4918673.1 hypothetical protein [Pseudomonadota bacterium]
MHKTAIASLALMLTACNLGPATSTTDSGDSTVNGGGTSIADIQTGVVADGETATLKGVLVSSPATWEDDGFFVQTPGGGENGGIFIYMPAGAPLLEMGDEITVTGSVSEFYEWTEFAVDSETSIQVTGTGTLTVDAVDLSTVGDLEVWESGLISVGASTVAAGPDNYGDFNLESGLVLDNLIHSTESEVGATYTDIAGQLFWSYDAWRIAPRFEDDLSGYSGGEPPSAVTISEIQNGDATGTVIVENAYVTSPLFIYDSEVKGFWIADDSGAWNGVYVYAPDHAEVEVGQTITTLTAAVDEYYDLTELKNAEITWGDGTVEALTTNLSEAPADWEAYEGVLVTVEATVTGEGDYGEWIIDWDGITVDDMFYDVTPPTDSPLYITGIVNYSYEEWKLCPRTESDISYQD